MLKKRIVPSLLLKNGRLVKSVQFGSYKDVGNPVTAARVYDAQRTDELIFLDIDASRENRGTLRDVVRRVAEECFMPLAVGGGIRSIDDIRDLIQNGADKVVINTAAVEIKNFISEAARIFGSSNITVSIDVKKNGAVHEVFTHSGTQATGLEVGAWAKEVQKMGAGEIFLTSIDNDGTMAGYDLSLVQSVTNQVRIPVIVSGGAGKLEDFVEVFTTGHADAASAASMFHFTDQSPIKVRRYLVDKGINVRV